MDVIEYYLLNNERARHNKLDKMLMEINELKKTIYYYFFIIHFCL